MSELKTQKDIHTSYGPYEDSDVELYKKTERQEAIKWIKAFRSGELWTDYACDDGTGHEAVESWIKHFFNISEEDLK